MTEKHEKNEYIRHTPPRHTESGNIEIEYRQMLTIEVQGAHVRLRVTGKADAMPDPMDTDSLRGMELVVDIESIEVGVPGNLRCDHVWLEIADDTERSTNIMEQVESEIELMLRHNYIEPDWLRECAITSKRALRQANDEYERAKGVL